MKLLTTRPHFGGIPAVLTLICLVAGATLFWSHRANATPSATQSYYVGYTGVNTVSDFTSLGCSLGAAGESGAIILDFGQPGYSGGYGAWMPGGSGGFLSVADVEARAKQFAGGFYNCASSGAFANIVIGTTNHGTQVNNGHGAAWAGMVNDLQSWITSPPSYSAHVAAQGGSDIELDWNSYTTSSGWVQSYDSVNQRNMYDFGAAEGCPATESGDLTGQTGTNLSCDNGWTQDNVAYVSWMNPAAFPLPESYSQGSPYSANAIEWQRIASYYHQHYASGWMLISGVLTQRGACDDVGGSGACPDTYNSPSDGYTQLWNALNYLDWGYVAQTPGWLTDINWTP